MKIRNRLLFAAVGLWSIVRIALFVILQLWLYTAVRLEIAKAGGVYETPEEGIRALCSENPYAAVTEIEIDHAGIDRHDGSQPHVWFVIAKVWTDIRPDGKTTAPKGYYLPGTFFVRTNEGWVHVPEGGFPHLLGTYMELLGFV